MARLPASIWFRALSRKSRHNRARVKVVSFVPALRSLCALFAGAAPCATLELYGAPCGGGHRLRALF